VRSSARRRDAEVQVPTDRWVERGPESKRKFVDLAELWRFRDLVLILAMRDLRVRYKQAAFGVAWAVLQPIIGTAILIVLFHNLAHLSTGGVPYVPFTLVGFSGWTYASSTVDTMTTSFVLDIALVTKVYYPRVATPLATSLTGAIGLAIGLVIAEIAALVEGITPSVFLLLLPIWLIALLLVSFGIGLPLATLHVKYRDVGQLVGFAIQLMLFLTPVAYSSSIIASRWQWLYHLNPMVAVLDGMRWSMLGAPAPGRTALVSAASGALLLIGGLRYFAKTERRFADVI
jgi:ABC-type polysaccharide/polyol phosphate export permease